ncbi:MAG: DUF2786 domain-containing protein [Sulfuritalea sp.]|nr:DUF2786 domain-containing protein [Sulfuritalea sp.]
MDKDQAIRKAQKLMAVAMDGRGNDNEAERALAQAETLIRKFGIEEAEIASAEASMDFEWADAFHAYGPPQNPARSCPRWFQIISTGVATFTDTIVRLHYDTAQGYGVGFQGDRADTLFAQWLVGYLKSNVWAALAGARKDHPEWGRSEAEDFRKAMAGRLSTRMRDLRRERDVAFSAAPNRRGTERRSFCSPTSSRGAMRCSVPRNTRMRALTCATRPRHTRVVWRAISLASPNRCKVAARHATKIKSRHDEQRGLVLPNLSCTAMAIRQVAAILPGELAAH